MNAASETRATREVVLGRNSAVWQALLREGELPEGLITAIGHRDLDTFAFRPGDRVWVYAYSRRPEENRAMLERLARTGGLEVVYVSSASTIVCPYVLCYEYPRVKAAAERDARTLLAARVLTLGLVHARPDELPRGTNMATRLSDLAAFMRAPHWPLDNGRRMNLFTPTHRPYAHALEAALHRVYGALQRAAGPWPCVLRPLDQLLRLAGMRWYGYVHLSNRLWTSTTS